MQKQEWIMYKKHGFSLNIFDYENECMVLGCHKSFSAVTQETDKEKAIVENLRHLAKLKKAHGKGLI